MKKFVCSLIAGVFAMPGIAWANEADLVIPEAIKHQRVLYLGFLICLFGFIFGLYHFLKVKKLPAHKAMLEVAAVIYETCKTYLRNQFIFLAKLFLVIVAVITAYFGFLAPIGDSTSSIIVSVIVIIAWTLVGIMGSCLVAFFGIRINTLANARMAFAALKRDPLRLSRIPLNSGMSIGVALISLELIMMLSILTVHAR